MFVILPTVTSPNVPRWERMKMGCGSVSLMTPMPVPPWNLGSSDSNLVRK